MDDDEISSLEGVVGVSRGSEFVPILGWLEGRLGQQDRVGGSLDVDVDVTFRVDLDGNPRVSRIESLDDRPVRTHHEALGLEPGGVPDAPEVDDHLEMIVAMFRRNGGHEMEPGRSPWRAPLVSHPERLIAQRQPLADRDGLSLAADSGATVRSLGGVSDGSPLDVEWAHRGGLGGANLLSEMTAHPTVKNGGVIMHGESLAVATLTTDNFRIEV